MQELVARRVVALLSRTLVFFLLLAPLPLAAHHGWGGYVDQTSELSGKVSSPVSLAGPHASLKITENGRVWDVVLAPPARTERAGLKDGMIPVGDTVVLHGNRHRDPDRREFKASRLTWNGRVFNVYPDRD